jgi:hypothetical protein
MPTNGAHVDVAEEMNNDEKNKYIKGKLLKILGSFIF